MAKKATTKGGNLFDAPRISVNNIGPVEEFEGELKPGINCLAGEQGSGKTTILRTVEVMTGGKTKPPTKRDGSRGGKAALGDYTIKVGRTVRKEGELDFEGVGDLDISVLHWPKYQDAKTRDKYRIAALIQLSQVQPDATLFHDLVGGEAEFNSLVDVETLQSSDLVSMSEQCRRAFHKAALTHEKHAETLWTKEHAERSQAEGIDLEAEDDEEVLTRQFEDAAIEQANINRQSEYVREVRQDAEEAREKLKQAESEYSGPTVDEAEERLNAADTEATEAVTEVDRLRAELAAAERWLENATTKAQAAKESFEAAKSHESAMKGWSEAVEAAEKTEEPSQAELDAAEAKVTQAREALATGSDVRRAKKAIQKAEEYAENARKAADEAQRLRDAARATPDILSDAIERIEGCPLHVWPDDDGNPRLCVATDRSKHEPFDELSDGERWNMILPLCCAENRVVVLPQSAYGEIQPAKKQELHELCEKHGVFLLTARVTDGPLTLQYGPGREAA